MKSVLEKKLQRTPTRAALKTLIVMTGLMSMVVIVANLMATKIWGLKGLPIDAGIILFPLSYVLGDLLMEIYGKQTADFVAWVTGLIGFLTMIMIFVTKILPSYPGADNSGFLAISAATGRVFCASIVGSLMGQLMNNYIFDQIRRRQKQRKKKNDSFSYRAFVSSAWAHIPDILFFEPIAFLGKLSFGEFVRQAVFAYVAAILIEGVLLLFVTKPLARYLVRLLRFQHGKRL